MLLLQLLVSDERFQTIMADDTVTIRLCDSLTRLLQPSQPKRDNKQMKRMKGRLQVALCSALCSRFYFQRNWRDQNISVNSSRVKRLGAFFLLLLVLGEYHIDILRNVDTSATAGKLHFLKAFEIAKGLSLEH